MLRNRKNIGKQKNYPEAQVPKTFPLLFSHSLSVKQVPYLEDPEVVVLVLIHWS